MHFRDHLAGSPTGMGFNARVAIARRVVSSTFGKAVLVVLSAQMALRGAWIGCIVFKNVAQSPGASRSAATVQLISTDRSLHGLCRAILSDLPYETSLTVTDRYSSESGPDICIWDYSDSAASLVFEERAACRKHLLLIERDQIGPVLDRLPCAPIGLLLKPITKATLATFLEEAVALCAAGARRARADRDGRSLTGRDDILQYLLQANLRLQEYDHDRTNFLARAVHDFRAPLTAVNGYCGLLLEGALGAFGPEQKEVLQRMQRSARRLTRMAASLHDLSVARHSPLRLLRQPYSIEDCVEQAVHELAVVADEKQISITMQITTPNELGLSFDPVRIEQLLVNILDNACKFTPRYGAIEITGYPHFWERRSRETQMISVERRCRRRQEPNSYRLDLRDSGPHISKSLLPLIFEEYTSYCGPEDRSGTGLGLAICRTIALAHQGNIWVSSEDDGVTFSLVLPLQSEPGPSEGPACRRPISSEVSEKEHANRSQIRQ